MFETHDKRKTTNSELKRKQKKYGKGVYTRMAAMEKRILQITADQNSYQKSVDQIHSKFDQLVEIL